MAQSRSLFRRLRPDGCRAAASLLSVATAWTGYAAGASKAFQSVTTKPTGRSG